MQQPLEPLVNNVFQTVLRNNSDESDSIIEGLNTLYTNVYQEGHLKERLIPLFYDLTLSQQAEVLERLKSKMLEYASLEQASYSDVMRIIFALTAIDASIPFQTSQVKVCTVLLNELRWNLSELIELVDKLEEIDNEMVVDNHRS